MSADTLTALVRLLVSGTDRKGVLAEMTSAIRKYINVAIKVSSVMFVTSFFI